MACNANIIGTMGLAAVGHANPGGAAPVIHAGSDAGGPAAPARPFSLTLRNVSRRQQMVVEAPITGLLALVLTVSLLVTPDLQVRGTGTSLPFLYGCPLFSLTGIPCLLCGMTRSFLAMGGFDVGRAFVFHPLGPVLYILTVASAVVTAALFASRKRLSFSVNRELRRRLILAGTLVLLLAWAAKIIIWRRTGLI